MKTFLNVACKNYTPPNPKKISQLVSIKYDYIASKLKKDISEIRNISLTMDGWTDTMNNRCYNGIHHLGKIILYSINCYPFIFRCNHSFL